MREDNCEGGGRRSRVMREDNCEGDDKIDDVMLPGFRFHPTDEELVVFYLRRKVQGRALHIELIKQVDIYKYDPWDLPKLAMTREKEWYFYCPRDRKYRNSVRPNRVTGAGFWKATGMDRPIYSSEGTTGKCIGLKKSLVFYRGRAAKGFKTDWMMHEFRLPPVTPGSNLTNNKLFDRNSIPPNDSWAICRIFKKAASMAQQRALSHHRPQFPPQAGSDSPELGALFSSKNTSCPTHIGSAVQLADHGCNNSLQNSSTNFSTMEDHSYRSDAPSASQSSHLQVPNGEALNNFILGPTMLSDINRASGGMYSQGPLVRAQISSHCVNPPRTMSFPFTHQSDTLWASPPCPSHISASFSTNKCYT